jgi:hypothetical protein
VSSRYDPAQPRDRRGEWTNGAPAVRGNISGKKTGPDLSTREGRSKALEGADVTTPAGRALVRKVQRASENASGPSAAERTRNARVMFGTLGKSAKGRQR